MVLFELLFVEFIFLLFIDIYVKSVSSWILRFNKIHIEKIEKIRENETTKNVQKIKVIEN